MLQKVSMCCCFISARIGGKWSTFHPPVLCPSGKILYPRWVDQRTVLDSVVVTRKQMLLYIIVKMQLITDWKTGVQFPKMTGIYLPPNFSYCCAVGEFSVCGFMFLICGSNFVSEGHYWGERQTGSGSRRVSYPVSSLMGKVSNPPSSAIVRSLWSFMSAPLYIFVA